jgi:putative salt-induced outer membrane protein
VSSGTNEFSGIERRTSETVGYGRRLLHTDTQTLSAQLGVGARQERLQGGGSKNSAIAQAGATYAWQFSKNSSFSEGVVAEVGANNTRLESQTALQVKMIENLAVAISYTVKYNTQVPQGTYKTDTYTSVSLAYSF